MDILDFKRQRPALFTMEGSFKACSTPGLHSHDCHQLLRIRSGTTLMTEEALQQPLFSNMTAFIPRGLLHRSVTLGGPVRYKSFYLDPGLWDPGIDQIRIFDLSPLGEALFDRISLDRAAPDPFDLKCLDLFFPLLDREIGQVSAITRIPVPKEPDNKRITDYMAARYQEKISLEDFSRVVNYSPRHLSRRFKADTGLTLFEFLRLYRIFQASILLTTSDAPVAGIGFDVGYESLSSFYTDFKALFSIPPKAFRALCRGRGRKVS